MNKVAIITGASSKIGSSIAEKLAKCKYDLVLNYNTSLEKTKKLREELINKYNKIAEEKLKTKEKELMEI